MRHKAFGRRLLAALAGSTPAFTEPARHPRTGRRRLLSALAGTSPAFVHEANDEYRTRASESTGATGPLTVTETSDRNYAVAGEQDLHDSPAKRVVEPGYLGEGRFARRLNELIGATFSTRPTMPQDPEWAAVNGRVAAALTARGHPTTRGGVDRLRRGWGSAPSEETVRAFAEYFGVDPEYFADDAYADRVLRERGYPIPSDDTALSHRRPASARDLSEESRILLREMAEKLRDLDARQGRIPPNETAADPAMPETEGRNDDNGSATR
ncbi:hypothetical protein [Nocardia transvalensis]|uniref:hypothetical protein n=1 Tax=Nocardia transvalensis TaxID=37333 RepID=UPI001893A75C|nr:hypothetical protein [Nocardia transvalensis]MBF6331941.1 hypothetical protein [Nocardia transvalensis]